MTIVTNPARSNSEDEIDAGCEIMPCGESSGLTIDDNMRLYDDEKQSDIVFVAGINGDTWRYPGHRRVLAATSPVFAALLSAKTDVIVVDYIDRRGFDQLLRYHYCEPTQLNSVATARCSLDAAYKFLCPQLAERCARRLDEMLNASVALEILRDLRFMCARLPGAASAPPLPSLTNDTAARLLAQCSCWCDSLAHNALLVLDENADEALTDERLEELTYEDLALIVKRDTLRVSSELVLAEALSRWSTAACKRTKRELTPGNKRAALGELAYCPRYLLLAGEELERALALELLEPMERALVMARARKLSAPVPVGAEQEGLLRQWARPRPTTPAALPVHLSARSEPADVQPSKLCARRAKRPKRPSFAPEERKAPKRGCCTSFCDGLLRAFICLFD
ncbi:BTB/POZ domain-containing protein 6 [Papilio machaon]|uniref:BTB/POZ domain-containing protein 6 n=1 Tax=Papilio machaon TaxID=76193 RepID=UPI001E665FF3|nr:BTB/POZ domain-containing protein 6 [Papilio machaon]